MNDQTQPNYRIPIILGLTAIILIVFTWTPLFSIAYNFLCQSQQAQNNLMVPTRVVSINYSVDLIMWFAAAIGILMMITYLLGRNREPNHRFFLAEGFALSFIIPHILLWIYILK